MIDQEEKNSQKNFDTRKRTAKRQMAAPVPFLGNVITLISKADVRYQVRHAAKWPLGL